MGNKCCGGGHPPDEGKRHADVAGTSPLPSWEAPALNTSMGSDSKGNGIRGRGSSAQSPYRCEDKRSTLGSFASSGRSLRDSLRARDVRPVRQWSALTEIALAFRKPGEAPPPGQLAIAGLALLEELGVLRLDLGGAAEVSFIRHRETSRWLVARSSAETVPVGACLEDGIVDPFESPLACANPQLRLLRPVWHRELKTAEVEAALERLQAAAAAAAEQALIRPRALVRPAEPSLLILSGPRSAGELWQEGVLAELEVEDFAQLVPQPTITSAAGTLFDELLSALRAAEHDSAERREDLLAEALELHGRCVRAAAPAFHEAESAAVAEGLHLVVDASDDSHDALRLRAAEAKVRGYRLVALRVEARPALAQGQPLLHARAALSEAAWPELENLCDEVRHLQFDAISQPFSLRERSASSFRDRARSDAHDAEINLVEYDDNLTYAEVCWLQLGCIWENAVGRQRVIVELFLHLRALQKLQERILAKGKQSIEAAFCNERGYTRSAKLMLLLTGGVMESEKLEFAKSDLSEGLLLRQLELEGSSLLITSEANREIVAAILRQLRSVASTQSESRLQSAIAGMRRARVTRQPVSPLPAASAAGVAARLAGAYERRRIGEAEVFVELPTELGSLLVLHGCGPVLASSSLRALALLALGPEATPADVRKALWERFALPVAWQGALSIGPAPLAEESPVSQGEESSMALQLQVHDDLKRSRLGASRLLPFEHPSFGVREVLRGGPVDPAAARVEDGGGSRPVLVLDALRLLCSPFCPPPGPARASDTLIVAEGPPSFAPQGRSFSSDAPAEPMLPEAFVYPQPGPPDEAGALGPLAPLLQHGGFAYLDDEGRLARVEALVPSEAGAVRFGPRLAWPPTAGHGATLRGSGLLHAAPALAAAAGARDCCWLGRGQQLAGGPPVLKPGLCGVVYLFGDGQAPHAADCCFVRQDSGVPEDHGLGEIEVLREHVRVYDAPWEKRLQKGRTAALVLARKRFLEAESAAFTFGDMDAFH